MTLGLLGKSAFLYAVGNVFMRAASFLLIPIYMHFLETEDVALLMILLQTVQFMLVAMNCGSEHSIVRYAKQYEKSNNLDMLMGTTFFITAITSVLVMCVCLTLLIPFFQLVLHRQDVFVLIAFTLTTACFQSLCDMLTSYYRSQHQPVKYVCVGIVTVLLLTVLSFIFIYIMKMGVAGALIAKIIAHGVVFGIVAWSIYSKTGFRISAPLVSKLLYFGVPLSMSSFGQFAITGVSIYFLSFLAESESVVIFSLGHKLASVLLMLLVIPFQLSFQPYVFSQLDQPEIRKNIGRLLTYLMWCVAVGSFCIQFGTRLLLPLIAPAEYSDAFLVTLFMMPAMAFLGLFYYGETLIKATNKSYLIGMVVTFCAVVSLAINFVLIKYLSWQGALLASNITLLLLGVSVFGVGLREYAIPIEWSRLRAAGFLFLGVLVINMILSHVNLYLYASLNVILGGVILLVVVRSPLWHESERQSVRRGVKKLRAYFRQKPSAQIERDPA